MRRKGTFQIAFYTGTRPGVAGVYNRAVRKRGRGKYSHVEIVFSDDMCGSASFMDGGVRLKPIEFGADWDFMDLPPELEKAARQYFEDHNGWKYDLMGNVFLTIGFVSHSTMALFCSEAATEALGIPEGFRMEPNALAAVLRHQFFQYRPIQK